MEKENNVHSHLEPACIILSRPDEAAEVQSHVVCCTNPTTGRWRYTWEIQPFWDLEKFTLYVAFVAGVQAEHDT